jgi:phosphate transport system permease protein
MRNQPGQSAAGGEAAAGKVPRTGIGTREQSVFAWWRMGEPWIWLSAGALAATAIAVAGLLALIAVRGLAHFWPDDVAHVTYEDAGSELSLVGRVAGSESMTVAHYRETIGEVELPPGIDMVERVLINSGNRDQMPPDFRWIERHRIGALTWPEDVVALERLEWGPAYGYLVDVSVGGRLERAAGQMHAVLANGLAQQAALRSELEAIESGELQDINAELETIRVRRAGIARSGRTDAVALAAMDAAQARLDERYKAVKAALDAVHARMSVDYLTLRLADGRQVRQPLSGVLAAWQPNTMSTLEKLGFYFAAIGHFLVEDPREANTEGGIFPALFGTVLMVLLMSVIVTPFGVVAAVYLREYARQGLLVRTVRIAVNNLAGVPSIVYGVFGLGFFVYFVGGGIDSLLFADRLPAPTFGTPGLLWASLTLAILTVPVVIVSTEEGLTRIPRAVREGSLALGASRAETLFRVVLPMASPSILTGVILAIARAAGEVAPLMLVGVVKLAPQLPIDGSFPFLHLERKFMHLGFHIYDVGFQSPNVEAARPLVFATALLLVTIILLLNLTAIIMRRRLEQRYRLAE